MRKFLLAATAAALLATPLLSGGAKAAPLGAAGLQGALPALSPIETVQYYVYRGRRHCWYPAGWHGAGWYWCGYRWRRGLGWGGPVGYRGWSYRGGPAVVVRPRHHRGPRVIIRP